jgi:hypothetical protein
MIYTLCAYFIHFVQRTNRKQWLVILDFLIIFYWRIVFMGTQHLRQNAKNHQPWRNYAESSHDGVIVKFGEYFSNNGTKIVKNRNCKKRNVLCDTKPCILGKANRCLWRPYFLHLQGRRVSYRRNQMQQAASRAEFWNVRWLSPDYTALYLRR